MTKNTLIRMSGWALRLGGSLFVWGVIDTGLQDMRVYPFRGLYRVYDASAFWGIFIIGPSLIALGMLGLRARYGKGMGGLGKACLAQEIGPHYDLLKSQA